MSDLISIFSELTDLPIDRLIGLIALGALALAGFALYVALAVVKHRNQS